MCYDRFLPLHASLEGVCGFYLSANITHNVGGTDCSQILVSGKLCDQPRTGERIQSRIFVHGQMGVDAQAQQRNHAN